MISWWRSAQGTTRTATMMACVVVFMGALGWAAVPLYDLFCRVTGYGGTTRVADAGAEEILDQIVTIRFDASRARGFPWEFTPMERTMPLRIGETGIAFYEAYNPTDRPVAGTASYNVTPYAAGSHFIKIDCFCFTHQVLQPGERVQMPVTFYVDPSLVEDPEARAIHTITLSYTFHEAELEPGDVQQIGTN